ncbi:MAG: L-glyceraldehyde 3-phosphate reductase [uncultured Paraburkholderia sp.]|nr:MAG: L-glyceraldehyde 3-phosphate reductase [uncultured Paraburkholderia sp.]CAH2911581.1 MAG: L-glyceraldehyde 3-phosphate reductase [uncultured Paraburkholderia sp.]CAH2914471.1 MAG: L-glyceraldehyde 3-phosphate reductase [uncultured Paraburkholderia sp.]
MAYEAASERYSDMQYRVCGKTGLKLPALSLGLWHNFGDTTPLSTQRGHSAHRFRPRHHAFRSGE